MRKLENSPCFVIATDHIPAAGIDPSSRGTEISSDKCSKVYLFQRWERGGKVLDAIILWEANATLL